MTEPASLFSALRRKGKLWLWLYEVYGLRTALTMNWWRA